MSKEIKAAARGLASLGRGEDKMLVHMTPREVQGLQALAVASGGTLTVNPHTGLPEAGWLSTILPMVAAGAATVFSGGTLSPLVAAAWGAGAGALGAKIEGEDPLMGAAGGALGGMGGAGLTSGIMNAGTGALQAGLTSQVAPAATGTAMGAAPAAAAPAAAGTQAGIQALPEAARIAALDTAAANPSALRAGTMAINNVGGGVSGTPPISYAAELQKVTPPSQIWSGGEKFGAGIKSLTQPKVATDIWKGLGNKEKLGVASTAYGLANSTTTSGGGKNSQPLYYHTTGNIDPITGRTTFGSGYWSKNYDYLNRGMYDPNNEIEDSPTYKYPSDAYAAGGPVGRYIQGRGDGVSDKVPAVIKTKGKGKKSKGQPAVLSNGEFVIPARHVAEIGNGSSEAGAQRLYAMMRRIEQRRKATSFGEDSKAYSELPV